MSDLDKRLSHFEANQTALNDMYGAEVMHNARKHIKELEQENQRLADNVDAEHKLNSKLIKEKQRLREALLEAIELASLPEHEWDYEEDKRLIEVRSIAQNKE